MALYQAWEGMEDLQMMLIVRFCKFQKTKPLNCHMQVSEGASRSCHDKTVRWRSPDKQVIFKCHDKLSKLTIVCFFDGNET